MNTLQALLLSYLLNSLWQVPLVFAAAWLAVRAARRSGSATEHRIWVAAIVLETVLPACALPSHGLIGSLLQSVAWLWNGPTALGETRIAILSGAGETHGQLRCPAHLLAATAIAYTACVAYFAARLLWRLAKTRTMQQQARCMVLTGHASSTWARCSSHFGVYDAEPAISREIASPVTIGIRRRLLLLPATLPGDLRAEDLDAAIAHEFAHMRRRDFAKNLVYAALSLPVAYHPLFWLTRARLEETREMVCDGLAAEALAGSHRYAHSLLRLAALFAQGSPDRTLNAIGIFDANIFERRVMNLTHKPTQLRGARRLATTAACIAIALGTCASALALHVNVTPQSSIATKQARDQENSTGAPTEPILISGKRPEFPVKMLAEKGKVDDTVIVALIVSKTGIPTMVVVNEKGSIPGFDQRAVEAVKQYRFKPALLDGKPVEYPMTIYVNFKRF